MAAKCQRPSNTPKVAEGPLGCGRRGPEAWEAAGRNEGTRCLLLRLGKRPNMAQPSPSVQGRGVTGQWWLCARSRQALGPVVPPAPSHGLRCTSAWCRCVPSPRSSWSRDCYGVILKQGAHLRSKARTLSPGLCQAVVELCVVGLVLPGSNAGDKAQRLLHPLLLPNLPSIKPWLYAVLRCTVGSSKYFLPCGFCLACTPWKNKIKSP